MILIRCPHCLELRTEEELTNGGEAGVVRPLDPNEASNDQWTNYLYLRANGKGLITEQWCCTYGCGQWFLVRRDPLTHVVYETASFQTPECSENSSRQVASNR